MEISKEKTKEFGKKILLSRMRILNKHSFFGLLLMHVSFSIDDNAKTAYTDGEKIVFGTKFLDELSDNEVDFVMMHEIMHIVLQHCNRGLKYDPNIYNIAADIVVNSNILYENNMDINSITLKKYGTSMHVAPNNVEGYIYSAEEVYEMLMNDIKNKKSSTNSFLNGNGFNDDHSEWTINNDELDKKWSKRIIDAAKAIDIRNTTLGVGSTSLMHERILNKLRKPKINWRTILNEFIQEEIVDYSFSPPDKRFSDFDFFLPDFNEKENFISNILFMIDTSASMTNTMITNAYSEIVGAIQQYNGKLQGYLGFFDASIVKPIPFGSFEEFKIIKPYGGGGTSFQAIFDYIKDNMDELPSSIIILTDGFAPFPKEENALGIPVLWLINNDHVNPPFGKVARIK